MAPTLPTVFRRRWWVAITSVIENLMFAAVLLGWSSLLLMLKNEGFYSFLCETGNVTSNRTNSEYYQVLNSTAITKFIQSSPSTVKSDKQALPHFHNEEATVRYTPSGYPTCSAQDELLNRYFSIGSSLLSGVTIILGVIMDKYGSRMIRLTGTITFLISCVLLAIGSLDTQNLSVLIAPAVCLNGMGGVVYIFTSFPVPNLFEDLRSTMISLMIGSYSASAIMYMLFKAAYDSGVPFHILMIFHACVGFLTFLNAYFNQPGKPIPGPEDISYAIKLHYGDFRFEHKISGKQFLDIATNVGRRMSSVDTNEVEHFNYLTSACDLKEDDESSKQEMSFLKVLITPCILLSFVTMCITQLRLIAYMGWLELYFRSACQHKEYSEEKTTETVEFYTFLFGLLQINCFLMAPVIGTIMDWKLKDKKKDNPGKTKAIISTGGDIDRVDMTESCERNGHIGNGTTKNGISDKIKKSSKDQRSAKDKSKKAIEKGKRKKQQITNLIRALFITNILLCVFGVIIQFEHHLELQILAFVIHTAIRTFLHSSLGALYACMFHFSHFGKLTGISSFLSAVFILIADPLFVVINSQFGGDPFWINFAMLMCSLLGFGLPIYLLMYRRKMNISETEESRELFSIDEEKEASGSADDEEAAPYISSVALAL